MPPFGIYTTLVPRGDGPGETLTGVMMFTYIPNSSSLPLHSFLLDPEISVLDGLGPESVQPQPLGRQDALGRGVRGWPVARAMLRKPKGPSYPACVGARAPGSWIHGSVDPTARRVRLPGNPGGVHAVLHAVRLCRRKHSISRAATPRPPGLSIPFPHCMRRVRGDRESAMRGCVSCPRYLRCGAGLKAMRGTASCPSIVMVFLFICAPARLRRSVFD